MHPILLLTHCQVTVPTEMSFWLIIVHGALSVAIVVHCGDVEII